MRIHGMVQEAPNTATFLLMGMFAILGMPPFGLFFSKFNIIFSLFKNGQYLLGSLLIFLLAGILIGILYHVMRMLSGKAKRKADSDLLDHTDTPFLAAMLIGSIILGMGLERIPYLSSLLAEASQIVVGGVHL